MTAETTLSGLASNDIVPGEYFQIDFAAGASSNGSATYAVVLLGNKTSAGSATADTVIYGPDTTVSMSSEQDAINLFGTGSELHRQVRRFYAVNKTTPLYAVAVTESVGANATGVITVATTSTGVGTLRVYVGDEFADSPIATGDTVTVIAAAAKAAINSKTWWAVTADNAAGVLTLTAKQKGLRGNLIRFSAQILSGSSIATTVTPVASTLMSSGTTADSNVTALATILPFRYYYIVSAAEDATQVGAVLSQINTQANPVPGVRQRAIAGSLDSIANVNAIAVGLNGARCEVVWQVSSDWTPAELAANAAAVYTLEEAPAIPRLNFDFYGNDAQSSSNWKVRAPRSGLAPTRAQLLSALNNGVTPITSGVGGSSYLVKRITSRSLNGAVADYRIRDAHKVTVCDRYADDAQAKFASQFRGKQIADNPKQNETAPVNAVTPAVLKAAINRLTRDYGEDGLLQRVGEIIADTQTERSQATTTRLTARIPLQPIDVLDQIATKIEQVA